jgi:hypothetical protein
MPSSPKTCQEARGPIPRGAPTSAPWGRRAAGPSRQGRRGGGRCRRCPSPRDEGGERSVDSGGRGPNPSSRPGTRHRHASALHAFGCPRVTGAARRRSTRPRGIPLRPSVRTRCRGSLLHRLRAHPRRDPPVGAHVRGGAPGSVGAARGVGVGPGSGQVAAHLAQVEGDGAGEGERAGKHAPLKPGDLPAAQASHEAVQVFPVVPAAGLRPR